MDNAHCYYIEVNVAEGERVLVLTGHLVNSVCDQYLISNWQWVKFAECLYERERTQILPSGKVVQRKLKRVTSQFSKSWLKNSWQFSIDLWRASFYIPTLIHGGAFQARQIIFYVQENASHWFWYLVVCYWCSRWRSGWKMLVDGFCTDDFAEPGKAAAPCLPSSGLEKYSFELMCSGLIHFWAPCHCPVSLFLYILRAFLAGI